MIGTRQMERVLSQAHDAGAKVVMVGDPEQLQAIEAGAAFRSLIERHGAAEITEIRRQREEWQRDATRGLATGRTGEAIDAYYARGMVHVAYTREAAREALVNGWDRERQADPGKTRIILTHTNAEVRELNGEARARLRETGDLGDDVTVKAERGERAFATGDRIMFLRNERGLGVKNGTLGTIERVSATGMAVTLDDGRSLAFATRGYAHVDHGYAATVHKSQGVTVDQAHVLATPGMDRHAAYVGLSRHRDGVRLHYGRDDFADDRQLVRTLSRDRSKDMASDHARDRDEQDRARAFADRREIRFSELAREMVVRVEAKARSMFAGFRPKPTSEKATSPEQGAGRLPVATISAPADQARRIGQYARAWEDIERMRGKGLPVLPHQESALKRAGDALDQARHDGARDLASAFERSPRLAREAAEGRVGNAQHGMMLESAVRADPELRAERFLESWRDMTKTRADLTRTGDHMGAEKIGKQMENVTGSLHRDPQLESVLRRRAPELELSIGRGRSIGQELTRSLDIGRGRDHGMSR